MTLDNEENLQKQISKKTKKPNKYLQPSKFQQIIGLNKYWPPKLRLIILAQEGYNRREGSSIKKIIFPCQGEK